ncbi:MAG: HEAT repeat domain-containing protein [Gemmatales bacterium]|nr:HEAT repeat domain-containing protein [Gemmatales bacterium]
MKPSLMAGVMALVVALPAAGAPSIPEGRPLPELVGEIITIRQGSRPGEQFITLRAWERPDKTIVRYLRSKETAELATLVQVPGQLHAQLYRWGPGRTEPPPGVPTIPEVAPYRLPETTAPPMPNSHTPTPWKPARQQANDAAMMPSQVHTDRPSAKPSLLPEVSSSQPNQSPSYSHSSSTQANQPATTSQQAVPNYPPPVPTTATSDHAALLRYLHEVDRAGGLITLQFPDQKTHTCVILGKTVAVDGTVSLTVRSQSTGEIMTVTTAPVNAPAAILLPVSPGTDSASSTGQTVSASAVLPPTHVPPQTAKMGNTASDTFPREGFWERLRRRLGLGTIGATLAHTTAHGSNLAPAPALAPLPRELGPVASDTASSPPGSETRIIIGPVNTPSAISPLVTAPTSNAVTSPSGQETRTVIGPVHSPATSSPAGTASISVDNPSERPPTATNQANLVGPSQPSAEAPVSSAAMAPISSQNRAPTPSEQAAQPPERRGLLNRWFRRDVAPASTGSSAATTRNTSADEQAARLRSQILQLAHLAAFQAPKHVASPQVQTTLSPPPRLNTQTPALASASKPDPLSEPEKYVKNNPVRRDITNVGLVANLPTTQAQAPSVLPSGQDKPNSTPEKPEKNVQPGSFESARAKAAPVPMPFVPLVTDKPRPDVPPPQPPIQPFQTLPVAAMQNPHMFPPIVPPVVLGQPNIPATPVAWTRGPLVPPHQSPVPALALQSGQSGTEALALRNTLFLTNVLQSSGSPQQREWAAARLAVIEPQRYPFAVEALVQAVERDPHPAVRIKALQSLTLMRADSSAVRQALHHALRDPDPRIREHASYALQLLGPTTSSQSNVVPVHHAPTSR